MQVGFLLDGGHAFAAQNLVTAGDVSMRVWRVATYDAILQTEFRGSR